jgi:hypothetical protein
VSYISLSNSFSFSLFKKNQETIMRARSPALLKGGYELEMKMVSRAIADIVVGSEKLDTTVDARLRQGSNFSGRIPAASTG